MDPFLSDLKRDMGKALEVMDVDGGVAMYRIASKKSVELSLLPLRFYDGDDLKRILAKILGIIILHATVALRLPTEAISATQLDKIAYIIGTKIFTAKEIKLLAGGEISFSNAGVSVAEVGDLSVLAAAL